MDRVIKLALPNGSLAAEAAARSTKPQHTCVHLRGAKRACLQNIFFLQTFFNPTKVGFWWVAAVSTARHCSDSQVLLNRFSTAAPPRVSGHHRLGEEKPHQGRVLGSSRRFMGVYKIVLGSLRIPPHPPAPSPGTRFPLVKLIDQPTSVQEKGNQKWIQGTPSPGTRFIEPPLPIVKKEARRGGRG